MLARRFALPSIQEPPYDPKVVPAAEKGLAGTVLCRPSREQWLAGLGELVQMCNEAMRRKKTSRDAKKPLSLEYMADRLDVDDPLFGYMAVTEEQGWLQGFVTVTTFTTWHRHFRWDSTHPCSGMHGSGDALRPLSSSSSAHGGGVGGGVARLQDDGELSTELMRETYAGDPAGEGIVWPRIAEIALLGAIGARPPARARARARACACRRPRRAP